MGIRQRIERIEGQLRYRGEENPPAAYSGPALAIRALDGLIGRLNEHTRVLENDPAAFFEGYDDGLYCETIEEHAARVDALLEALDERDEEWRREHRPDLVGVPNEINDPIVELRGEIERLEDEGAGGV